MRTLIQLFFLLISISAANAQNFNPLLAAKLQTTLDSMVALSSNTKGMAAGVYYPEQGVWTGATGLSYTGVPLTAEMEMALASNSKLFTAVVMLKLAENNVLTLEDSLHEWLPNYPNVNPNATIRQLLNHTSGIADMYSTQAHHDSIDLNPNRVWTPQEVLTWIGAPLFSPGANYSYSNTNYILAGMVAESATGLHISQLIRNNILTPLQLDSTFFPASEPTVGTVAHPWKNGIDIDNIPRTSLHTAIGPAGAIYSTPSEMAQWYHALMSGQIINANSLAQMTTFAAPATTYGLGISLFSFNGRTIWGHGGITEGSRTRTVYDPCLKAFVCGLSNSNPSGVDGITVLLHKVLVDYLPGCAGVITGTTTVCQGQNAITYTVPAITNATSYAWSLPNGATGTSTTNSITVDYGIAAISGNVIVKGVNAYGVGGFATLSITVNNMPNTPTITQVGNDLHSDAATGNQWYDQNGLIVGATNQDYTPTANGGFYVLSTVSNCSSDTSSVFNFVLSGMENLAPNQVIKVYPNPVSNDLVIELPEDNQSFNFEISNAIGQNILSGNLLNKKTIIQMQNLVAGIYFVNIKNENFSEFKKIIKE